MNNVGSFQNNEDKRLKKLHMTIDSRQRDKKVYYNPNNYRINLDNNNRLKNVNSIRLLEAMIPNSQYLINENNNKLDILDNATGLITPVLITIGNYSATTLTTELESIAGITTATFSPSTKKLTLISSSNITILFETGDNANCSPWEVLGANKEDMVINLSNTFPNIYNLETTKFIDLAIEEIPDITNKLMIEKEINKFRFKRISMDVDFDTDKHYRSLEQLPYNYFTPMEFNKFSITLYDDKGRVYDSNGKDNYFIFEMTMLADESPDNVSFFPPPPIENETSELETSPSEYVGDGTINIAEKDNLPMFNNNTLPIPPTSISVGNDKIPITDIPKDDILEINDKSTDIFGYGLLENMENMETNIPSPVKKTKKTNDSNKYILIKIEKYIKDNKITVVSISLFLLVFLIIYSRKR